MTRPVPTPNPPPLSLALLEVEDHRDDGAPMKAFLGLGHELETPARTGHRVVAGAASSGGAALDRLRDGAGLRHAALGERMVLEIFEGHEGHERQRPSERDRRFA